MTPDEFYDIKEVAESEVRKELLKKITAKIETITFKGETHRIIFWNDILSILATTELQPQE